MTAPSTEPTLSTEPDGATPPAPTAEPTAPAKEDGLGEAGKKALQAERDARKALEKQLADLSPLADLVKRIRGGDGVPEQQKTEVDKLTERLAEVEKTATAERMARMRLEVAAEKGLTAAQAARLSGSSKEELAADADALLSLFPTSAATPGTLRPDRSQGARGGAVDTLDAQIAAAEAAGNTREVLALKARQLTSLKPTK